MAWQQRWSAAPARASLRSPPTGEMRSISCSLSLTLVLKTMFFCKPEETIHAIIAKYYMGGC
jgi:hypothetical protein